MLKLPDGEREQSRGVQPERGLGPDLLGPLAKRASRGERVAIRHLLEAITPQGALLSYQGERELLPLNASPFRRP